MIKRILSRLKLSRICADYDAGALTNTRYIQTSNAVKEGLAVLAMSDDTIPAGSCVTITGFVGNLDRSSAASLYANKRIILKIELTRTSKTADGVVIDSAGPGRISRVVLKNAFFHEVTIKNDLVDYVDSNYVTVAKGNNEAFAIAALSSVDKDNKAFAVLSTIQLGKITTTFKNVVENFEFASQYPITNISCDDLVYVNGAFKETAYISNVDTSDGDIIIEKSNLEYIAGGEVRNLKINVGSQEFKTIKKVNNASVVEKVVLQ